MVRAQSVLTPIRRGMAIAMVATAGFTSLVACTPSGSNSSDGASQTWIVPQDWDAIDPTRVTATNTGAILLVAEPLVLLTPSGSVTPNLATQSQPNATTYVYKLRNDAKFSDGKPVTIDDVKYSFDIHAAKDSTSSLAGNFADVASIEAKGGDELVITLNTPDVQFEATVGSVGIVEKAVRETLGKNPGAPDTQNVGSGPYTVSQFQPGSELVLKRNPNYWGKAPSVETLRLKLITDASARQLAVQSGEVTGAFEIPASEAKTYAGIDGMKVISGDNPSVMLFNVNTNVAPWNDEHVRKAVSLAIDRAGIVKSVLAGHGEALSTPITAQKAELVMDKDTVNTTFSKLNVPYDVAAAKAELAKSTVPTGFTANVVFSDAERATSGLVGQAIAESVKPLGITLNVSSIPDSQYTDAVFFKQTAPASIVDFTTDRANPISLFYYLGSSVNSLASGGYTNISGHTNPALDQTLADYLATPGNDKTAQAKLLGQALDQFNEQQPYIPIYNSDYLAVVKAGVNFEDFDGFWWQRRWTDEVTIAK
ncbi:UNVERIFIED_ORG: peptide/nickel transport system substrate-binding protein [Paenarthrobacter nicotinovorans]